MRRALLLVAAGVVVVAGTGLVYRYDPARSAFFPPCVFHALTGLHCPGCGSLRALHALLRGQWTEAVAMNSLAVFGAPLLLAGIGREAWRLATGIDPIRARAPAWSIYALLGLLVVFAVLRNLPGFAWLAPGD